MGRTKLTVLVLALLIAAGCEKKENAVYDSKPVAYHVDIIPRVVPLSGQWGVRLDPEDEGEAGQWFNSTFAEMVKLPGSLAENGLGDDVTVETKWTGGIVDQSWFTDEKYAPYRESDNVKVPFWLQPVKYYVGKAWYQRTIDIDKAAGKWVVLHLEKCHWDATVWVDDKQIETQNSLSTPNEFLLGELSAGEHRLTICVDNTVKIAVGDSAHSVSDHTQSNWNGIVGDIYLEMKQDVNIEDVQVYPDLAGKKARVEVTVVNIGDEPVEGEVFNIDAVTVSAGVKHNPEPISVPYRLEVGENVIKVDYPMGEGCLLWDEFSPNVYQMKVGMQSGYPKKVEFGMREFGVDGTQFTINGRKTFLRGTLECCIFPLTGYPAMDEEYWEKIITAAKAHGLNHIRFHSWCPPEAAFDVADRMGVYLQVECGGWGAVGDGKPVDKFYYEEGDRILKYYGNHPSFVLMAYGNEPGGGKQGRYLGDLVNYWKAKDGRRLYTSASGWPKIPENQFHVDPSPRIQHWGAGLKSRINSRPPETMTDYLKNVTSHDVPLLSHEIGQWCVYPNFKEIEKYTGVLKAKNFEIFRNTLEANHMGDQADDFLIASGKLQTLCYKEDIESLLRTPGMGGFQLLDLHDFPGQGTALVGVLDPFWEYKGYVTAEQYKSFCGPTVPLAKMTKRTWENNETFTADIVVAHYGAADLENAKVSWTITDESEGSVISSGSFTGVDIAVGQVITAGKISLDLNKITAATKLVLTSSVDGVGLSNSWGVWVYTAKVETAWPTGVKIARQLDEEAMKVLGSGGKVLLLPLAGSVKGGVPAGFSSIFWNTAWTRGQAPHTLGILCDPKHRALVDFPTEYHSNWQWWDIVTKGQAMVLNDLPVTVRPIVQVIDDWFTNRRLALVFEAKVNGGKVVICSVDIETDIENRPVARQLRRSLIDYMVSDGFDPEHEVTVEQINGLIKEPSAMQKYGASIKSVDSQANGNEAVMAIDGNASTCWHTEWQGVTPDYPHEIVIEFDEQIKVSGLKYLPRQDMRNGWISEYEVYVSSDGRNWSEPAAAGSFERNAALKTIPFDKQYDCKYLRFVAVKGIDGQKFASVGELEVIIAN